MFKVSWFPELTPGEKILEEKILNLIKNSYQQHWYTIIETPAVERNSVLTAKWGNEINKQIFWLYGLAQWCEKDTKDYSLHFDLTVPFARYVIDHKQELTFPFKRSQIQKVWRWERAQKWRFREFYQADIDVIWDDKNSTWTKYLFYDAEIIFVLIKTLEKLFNEFNLDKKIIININHKKIISGFLKYLKLEDKVKEITTIIDKKDKITKEVFVKELKNIWLNKEQINKIISFTSLTKFTSLTSLNDELCSWIKDLEIILNYLDLLWVKDKVQINLWIMRGLDYYTWIVFETFIKWQKSLGSIASWWRYENLTKFIDYKTAFSGVGGSIWISRLESYLFNQIKSKQKTTTEYLFINFPETQKEIFKLYQIFLQKWKNVEIYPAWDKLGKQFKYADKKLISYCVILWEEELKNWVYKIKNMKTWETKSYKLSYYEIGEEV